MTAKAMWPSSDGGKSLRTTPKSTRLAGLVNDGRLRVIIDPVHDLNEIETAFARFGHETLGNIIVDRITAHDHGPVRQHDRHHPTLDLAALS